MDFLTITHVLYLIVAIALVIAILLQNGSGASAGSGFGAGASATVFGSTGSSNFMTKLTKWIAIIFFAMSVGMAWQASRKAEGPAFDADDIGAMADLMEAPETGTAAVDAADIPTLPEAGDADLDVPVLEEAPKADEEKADKEGSN